MILNRMTGPYAVMYWMLIAGNIVTPQFLWFLAKCARRKIGAIVRYRHGCEHGHVAGTVRDRHHQFAPRFSAVFLWNVLIRTRWTFSAFFGTIGLFLFLRFCSFGSCR